jgi:hypothetical protein
MLQNTCLTPAVETEGNDENDVAFSLRCMLE